MLALSMPEQKFECCLFINGVQFEYLPVHVTEQRCEMYTVHMQKVTSLMPGAK